MTKKGPKIPTKSQSSTVSPELMIKMYQDMVFYRKIEERINLAYTQQKFSGFCHLHIGQEALCVGTQTCLRPDDYMISGYRSHTQAIAKGIPPEQVVAELFGKVDGCSRGKGGSMHMFSAEHNFLGGHGIVGGQVPLAAGVGFAIKYRDGDQIIVCYLGDAAINQGQFYEALNLAAIWNLPCLFIIENNRYGMGTAISRTTSIKNLYERALAFDMKHSAVNAMDVLEVHEHLSGIISAMRQDKKPYLLEAHCYRYKGHSVSDPGSYRTKEEVLEYQKRDPILTHGARLLAAGIATEKDLKSWDQEAKDRAKAAENFADQAALPEVQEAYSHVYPEPLV